MPYFYIKRKTKKNKEAVGNYVFTNGVLFVEDSRIAAAMNHNLSKYYGAKMSDKSPDELKIKESKVKGK